MRSEKEIKAEIERLKSKLAANGAALGFIAKGSVLNSSSNLDIAIGF